MSSVNVTSIESKTPNTSESEYCSFFSYFLVHVYILVTYTYIENWCVYTNWNFVSYVQHDKINLIFDAINEIYFLFDISKENRHTKDKCLSSFFLHSVFTEIRWERQQHTIGNNARETSWTK